MRVLLKALLFSLSVVLVSPVVLAAESRVVSNFRKAAVEAFTQMKADGVKEIEGIGIETLLESAKTVAIFYDKRFTVRTTTRGCAIWQKVYEKMPNMGSDMNISAWRNSAEHNLRNGYIEGAERFTKMADEAQAKLDQEIKSAKIIGQSIRLNDQCILLGADELKELATQEVLGVTGAKDLNYGSTLRYLNRDAKQFQNLQPQRHLQRRGGSVVVSGGGDVEDLRFKRAGLRYLTELGGEHATYKGLSGAELFEGLLQMELLPASDVADLFVGIDKYDYQPTVAINGYWYRAMLRSAEYNAEVGAKAIEAAYLYVTTVKCRRSLKAGNCNSRR